MQNIIYCTYYNVILLKNYIAYLITRLLARDFVFVPCEQIKGQKLCDKTRARPFSTLYKTPSILTNESKTLTELHTHTVPSILIFCQSNSRKLHVHRAKHTINEISANETSKQRYRSAGVFNRWFTTSRSFLIERFHD